MKYATLLLFFATLATAKDKGLPMPLTVDVSSRGSITTMSSPLFVYTLSCQHWTCYRFEPGTELTGREGSTLGVPWMELTWKHKGKLKSSKYTIEFKSRR